MWQRVETMEHEPEPSPGAPDPGTGLATLRGELLATLDRLVSRVLARSTDPRMREVQRDALTRAALGLGALVRELAAERALLASERDGRILLSLVVETEHALAEVYGPSGGERAAALAQQLGVAARCAFQPVRGGDWSGTASTR